jgi:hypothetical protein
MEALSLGTPLIIACTGGHRMFMELKSPGVLPLAEAEPQALAQAILSNRHKRSDNLLASEANRRLFRNFFSDAQYRARLDHFLSDLLNDSNSQFRTPCLGRAPTTTESRIQSGD